MTERWEVPVRFEEYVRVRGPALLRFARLVAGDPHLGEDLVQEVLTRAYARWPRIARMDRPDLYLRQMVVHANASWWKRRSHHERPTGELLPESTAPAADIEDRDALWQQLRRLSRNQRVALVLRYYEDQDDATIAEMLGCSPSTVRTHLMRALATLRSRLAEPDPTTSDARSMP
jgi:RNA polymerase sigma-70 factor (sigma-E family)